jgi:hypothetical protein
MISSPLTCDLGAFAPCHRNIKMRAHFGLHVQHAGIAEYYRDGPATNQSRLENMMQKGRAMSGDILQASALFGNS